MSSLSPARRRQLIEQCVRASDDPAFTHDLLNALGAHRARRAYHREAYASAPLEFDREALGLILANDYAHAHISVVAAVAAAAFEDLNCHGLAQLIRKPLTEPVWPAPPPHTQTP